MLNSGEAINIAQRLFCDAEGFVHPITHWFDDDGEECPPDEAVAAVAGTEGRWFALKLEDFR